MVSKALRKKACLNEISAGVNAIDNIDSLLSKQIEANLKFLFNQRAKSAILDNLYKLFGIPKLEAKIKRFLFRFQSLRINLSDESVYVNL